MISKSGTTLKFSLYDRTCVRYNFIHPRSYCYGLRNFTNWDKRLTNSVDSFAGTTSCRWTSKSEAQLSMFFVREWGQDDRSYCWRARCPSTLYGWNGSNFWRISRRSRLFNRHQNENVVDYVKDVKDVGLVCTTLRLIPVAKCMRPEKGMGPLINRLAQRPAFKL